MPDETEALPHAPHPEESSTADISKNRPGPEVLHDMRDLSEDTARRLIGILERSHPVRAIRGSQIATAVVGTIGFALFLVGIENAAADIPIIDSGWTQMIVGIILLAAAGVLLRRFME